MMQAYLIRRQLKAPLCIQVGMPFLSDLSKPISYLYKLEALSVPHF